MLFNFVLHSSLHCFKQKQEECFAWNSSSLNLTGKVCLSSQEKETPNYTCMLTDIQQPSCFSVSQITLLTYHVESHELQSQETFVRGESYIKSWKTQTLKRKPSTFSTDSQQNERSSCNLRTSCCKVSDAAKPDDAAIPDGTIFGQTSLM